MDTSLIDRTQVSSTVGLLVGKKTAPKQIIEFLNLGCPYCKQWFEQSDALLSQYVAAGQLQRVIKLLDKEKDSLKRGTIMHHFVNLASPEKGLANIRKLFETSAQWNHLPIQEVSEFAQTRLQLSFQNNQQAAQAVIEEAEAASIQLVPTIFLGAHIFDESIKIARLQEYLAEK